MTDPRLQPPIEHALRAGAAASDLGEAFYEGYQAALLALVPGLKAPAALAVTESGGNHPRAIRTLAAFEGGTVRLDGEKAFVTGADRARTLLVAATTGTRDDGTPRIVVIRVDANAPGLRFEPLPPTPFAPGVGHARVVLDAVVVPAAAQIGDDGYRDVVKPFRTVEDIHVVAAIVAHLATRLWPLVGEPADRATERLEAAIAALRTLAAQSPADPATHRALAGTLALVRDALDPAFEALEGAIAADVFAGLQRDRALLRVADRARASRTAAAHRARTGPAGPR